MSFKIRGFFQNFSSSFDVKPTESSVNPPRFEIPYDLSPEEEKTVFSTPEDMLQELIITEEGE